MEGTYKLYNGKKIYKEDCLAQIMVELMKISKEVGCIPKVSYNRQENATEFRFEGYYCDFSIFFK